MKIILMLEGLMLTRCSLGGHNNINNDVDNCYQWQISHCSHLKLCFKKGRRSSYFLQLNWDILENI